MERQTDQPGLPSEALARTWAEQVPFPREACASAIEVLKTHGYRDVPGAVALAGVLADAAAAHVDLWVRAKAARAHFLAYSNRFEEATADLADAAAAADVHNLGVERGLVRLAAVQPLCRLGRLDEALASAEQAFGAFAARGMTREAAKARTNQAIVLRMRGDLRSAVEHFRAARADLEGDALACAVVDSNTAEALLELARFAEAEEAFEAAAREFAMAGNAHARAITEGNLADLFSRQGRIAAAIERFDAAIDLYRSSGAAGDAARLLAEQAEALASFGSLSSALVRYRTSLADLASVGLRPELARARVGLARVMLGVGAPGEAARLLRAVIAEDEGPRTPVRSEAEALLPIAELLEHPRGDAAAALARFELAAAGLSDRPLLLGRLVADMSSALLDAGRADLAGGAVARTSELARELGVPTLSARAAVLEARLAGAGPDPGRWRALSAGAMRRADALRRRVWSSRLRGSFTETWHGAYTQAALAAAAGPDPDAGLAFEALERLRVREQLDAVTPRALGAGDEEIAALRVLYDRLERADASAARAGLARQIAEAEDRLQVALERRAGAGGRGPADAAMDLDAALELLSGRGAGSVAYFAAGDSYHAMVLARGGARCVTPLASRERVDRLIRQHRLVTDQCLRSLARGEEPGSDDLSGLADQLGALLLAPVWRALSGLDRLVVLPFGALHAIPFAGLRVGGRHVVMDREVVVGTSWSGALGRGVVQGRALFVGVSDELAPGMSDEARSLARSIPGSATLAGCEATMDALRRLLPAAGLVHLATHCVFSPVHPESTRLKMADGWMTARELAAGVRAGAGLVLAGCETGRGSGLPGEDRSGLVRSLLSGGAGGVVSTLWPMPDCASVEIQMPLWDELVESPARGGGMSGALARAQRSCIEAGVHPSVWGAAQYTGSMSP